MPSSMALICWPWSSPEALPLQKTARAGSVFAPSTPTRTHPYPSIPIKNLWQCFGCGAAGDTIRFVELFRQGGLQGGGRPPVRQRLSGQKAQTKADTHPRTAAVGQTEKTAGPGGRLLSHGLWRGPARPRVPGTAGHNDKLALSAHKAGFATARC